MNKQATLKNITSAAYDVGFGAKKHFATFDIVEKAPGWLGLISLVGGIYGLFVPFWSSTKVSAVFVVFGIVSLYIGFYNTEKHRYEEAGKTLTSVFHQLHCLFLATQSKADGDDFSLENAKVAQLRDEAVKTGISKQVFMSDWYAHYKFFWQMQTDWIAEARPFNFWRDKVPLTAYIALLLLITAVWGMISGRVLCEPCSTVSAAGVLTSAGVCKP